MFGSPQARPSSGPWFSTLVGQMKRFLQRRMPSGYDRLRHSIGHPARMRRLGQKLAARVGNTVQQGPFRGMILSDAVSGSHLPKLLGSYEAELYPVVDVILQRPYRLVIDVGCGEGYYLVGLARQ